MPTNTEPTFTINPDGSLPIEAITTELYKLTEEYSLETYPAEHRNHLGVSIIGEKCSRHLFYSFRWVKLQQFPGRMRRLFSRGHAEEEKIDKLLSWMGFFVREIDPATDRQYKFSTHNGHYGGSGDGIALLPWFRTEDMRILVEKKTAKDKLFQKLKTEGLKKSNPKHWAQQCGYGKAFKLRYGLYVAVNKDDDDIYYELNELDWNYATECENKALDIIQARMPPPRINENPVSWDCKYCSHIDICHWGEAVEKNCRSCKFSIPVEKGEWKCTRFDGIIPKDFIKTGCSEHSSINE